MGNVQSYENDTVLPAALSTQRAAKARAHVHSCYLLYQPERPQAKAEGCHGARDYERADELCACLASCIRAFEEAAGREAQVGLGSNDGG